MPQAVRGTSSMQLVPLGRRESQCYPSTREKRVTMLPLNEGEESHNATPQRGRRESQCYPSNTKVCSEQMLLSIEAQLCTRRECKHFDHEGLHQLQCTECMWDVETFFTLYVCTAVLMGGREVGRSAGREVGSFLAEIRQ